MRQLFTRLFITFCVVFIPFFTVQAGTTKAGLDTLNMGEQFDYLFNNSNRYQEYKVLSITTFNALKQNALDSISVYSKQISTQNQTISTLNSKITDQAQQIESVTNELDKTKRLQDSMSLAGFSVSKEAYNKIMWGIIVSLLVLMGVVFSFFQRGHKVVRTTKIRLEEVQEEFETHRKSALVREQKLARELMDYKIKHGSIN